MRWRKDVIKALSDINTAQMGMESYLLESHTDFKIELKKLREAVAEIAKTAGISRSSIVAIAKYLVNQDKVEVDFRIEDSKSRIAEHLEHATIMRSIIAHIGELKLLLDNFVKCSEEGADTAQGERAYVINAMDDLLRAAKILSGEGWMDHALENVIDRFMDKDMSIKEAGGE